MEKITYEAFNEIVSKDADLKAKIDAIPIDENHVTKISEIVESLGYELLPDEEDKIEALSDDEIEEVTGGARCDHDFKFKWKEITPTGFKRMYYKCKKCGITMKQSTRVKQ